MLNIFNFKDTKKVDHILENSFFFDEIYVIYQLSEIKDDIRFVSQFLCLLRHPVEKCPKMFENFHKRFINTVEQ